MSDQLEAALGPVGEYPDLPSGMPAVLNAANQISAACAAVKEIRALHKTLHGANRFCDQCLFEAPCPTVQILDRHGL